MKAVLLVILILGVSTTSIYMLKAPSDEGLKITPSDCSDDKCPKNQAEVLLQCCGYYLACCDETANVKCPDGSSGSANECSVLGPFCTDDDDCNVGSKCCSSTDLTIPYSCCWIPPSGTTPGRSTLTTVATAAATTATTTAAVATTGPGRKH